MGEHGKEEEREEEEEDADETSFTDEDQRTVTVGRTSGRDGITRVADGDIPKVGRDAGAIKRSNIAGVKRGFSEAFGMNIKVGDGEESKDLKKRTRFDFDKKDFVSGVSYDRRKIYVRKKGGGIEASKDKKSGKAFEDFWEHVGRVRKEHPKTFAGAVEKVSGDSATSEEVVAECGGPTGTS